MSDNKRKPSQRATCFCATHGKSVKNHVLNSRVFILPFFYLIGISVMTNNFWEREGRKQTNFPCFDKFGFIKMKKNETEQNETRKGEESEGIKKGGQY